ncbi:hypothetical protein MBLNU230_g1904t1 [Neophaeotheca triangularis]
MANLAPPEDRMDVAATPDSSKDIDIDFDLGDVDQIKDDEQLQDVDETLEDGPDGEQLLDVDEDMEGETLHAVDEQMDEAHDDEEMNDNVQGKEDPTTTEQIDANDPTTLTATTITHSTTLPISLLYDGFSMTLFTMPDSEQGWIDDENFYNLSLNALLGKIRSHLEGFPNPPASLYTCQLEAHFPQLRFKFIETEAHAYQASLSDIVNLYLQMQYNDGIQHEDVPELEMSVRFCESFALDLAATQRAAAGGVGFSQLAQVMDWDVSPGEVGDVSHGLIEGAAQEYAAEPEAAVEEETVEQQAGFHDERQGREGGEPTGHESDNPADFAESYEPGHYPGLGTDGAVEQQYEGEGVEGFEQFGQPEEESLQEPDESDYDAGELETQRQKSEAQISAPEGNDISTLPEDVPGVSNEDEAQEPTAANQTQYQDNEQEDVEEEDVGELLSEAGEGYEVQEEENGATDGEFVAEKEGIEVAAQALGEHAGGEDRASETQAPNKAKEDPVTDYAEDIDPNAEDDAVEEDTGLAAPEEQDIEAYNRDDADANVVEVHGASKDMPANKQRFDRYTSPSSKHSVVEVEDGTAPSSKAGEAEQPEALDDGEAAAAAVLRAEAELLPALATKNDANPANSTEVDYDLGHLNVTQMPSLQDASIQQAAATQLGAAAATASINPSTSDVGIKEPHADDKQQQTEGENPTSPLADATITISGEIKEELAQQPQDDDDDSKTASIVAQTPTLDNSIEEGPEDDIVWDDLTPTEYQAQEAAKTAASPTTPAKRPFDEFDEDLFTDDDEPEPALKKSKSSEAVEAAHPTSAADS